MNLFTLWEWYVESERGVRTQEGETNDQPAVAWAKGEKPMMEALARSNVWWYVEVVAAVAGELRVAYPGARAVPCSRSRV